MTIEMKQDAGAVCWSRRTHHALTGRGYVDEHGLLISDQRLIDASNLLHLIQNDIPSNVLNDLSDTIKRTRRLGRPVLQMNFGDLVIAQKHLREQVVSNDQCTLA